MVKQQQLCMKRYGILMKTEKIKANVFQFKMALPFEKVSQVADSASMSLDKPCNFRLSEVSSTVGLNDGALKSLRMKSCLPSTFLP